MANIYFDLAGFGRPLPNGLASPTSGNHRVRMARLVWAATTIGVTPFGPRLHAGRALEVQWRSAMIRAAIQPGPDAHWRSDRYARLDPSEKGAVSFFLGQAQAKLFAHDFFRVSRFVHYDAYLAYYGRPRRRTRPDFIGFYGKHVAIGVEAKGRSLGFNRSLITKAKQQASRLPGIQGHPAPATYVHVAYFDHDQWCAHLEDPPRQRRVQLIDPAILTMVYYLPIVNAIRARLPARTRLVDDAPYLRAYFEEVDVYLSVRADIADLVVSDEVAATDERRGLKLKGDSLYQFALSLDVASANTPSLQEQETESFFLGGDGVAVELGSTWADWPEPEIQ